MFWLDILGRLLISFSHPFRPASSCLWLLEHAAALLLSHLRGCELLKTDSYCSLVSPPFSACELGVCIR